MATITVIVSGPVGCGKSAICGEIEIALKAIGVPVMWDDIAGARQEKHMTGANWIEYIEMYKPDVILMEESVPAVKPINPARQQ